MKITCELDFLGNVKLFSYFAPNKFENLNILRKLQMLDVTGFLLTFLNRNTNTNDLMISNNQLIYSFKPEELENNFKNIDSFDIANLCILYNEETNTTVLTIIGKEEEYNYSNCIINDLKIKKNKLTAINCKLSNTNNTLLIDTTNYKFSIFNKTENEVIKKYWDKIG